MKTKYIILIAVLLVSTLSSQVSKADNSDSLSIRAKAKKLGVPSKHFDDFFQEEMRELKVARSMKQLAMSLPTSQSPCTPRYIPVLFANLPTPVSGATCNNVDFEDGNFTNWYCTYGNFENCNVNNFHCSNSLPNGLPLPGRHSIMSIPFLDPYGKFPVVAPGGQHSVMIGNNESMSNSEEVIYSFTVDAAKPLFVYQYAVVLEDPGHDIEHQPFLEVTAYDLTIGNNYGQIIDCSMFKVVPTPNLANAVPGFQTFPGLKNYNGKYSVYGGVYKDWSSNYIDLHQFVGKNVAVVFKTADCALGLHFGYAYVEGSCKASALTVDGDACVGNEMEFSAISGNSAGENFLWKVDGTAVAAGNIPVLQHTFSTLGNHVVTCTYSYLNTCNNAFDSCKVVLTANVTIENCDEEKVSCAQCISSFAPLPGKKYILSAWVKEEYSGAPPLTYLKPAIRIDFPGANVTYGDIKAKDGIIDGWQRINYEFEIPIGASKIDIQLRNTGSSGTDVVYFDDVRVYPLDGMMKSFVFDPLTSRLMAELDENNYATFYEYDEEGGLIRVKKETEKGIKTIKEVQKNVVIKKP